MNNTYLSRIAIRNFRTFGNFEIEIPAAPGLVLLTGTNGLGKSSFFDALEWCLTTKIRRFEPYLQNGRKKLTESDYLTRRGAEEGSHRVALTFSDGNPIKRGAADATPMSAIIAQLARADRRSIDDLGIYLALTHFLGQAAQQRFTSRDPQDQWQALKGPSGIERLERIRAGLRGRLTITAFTRRLDQEQAVVASLERQIADWQGWTVRLERLRSAARATGILTVAELVERIEKLEADLAQLIPSQKPAISGEEPGRRLAGLLDRIGNALRLSADHRSILQSLAQLPAQYLATEAERRLDNPILLRLRGEVSEVRERIERAVPLANEATTIVTTQASTIARIEQNIALLEAARTDLSRRETLLSLITADEADRVALGDSIAGHRFNIEAADAIVSQQAAAAADVARLRSLVASANALSDSMRDYFALEVNAGTALASLSAAREHAKAAETELAPLIARAAELKTQITNALQVRAEADRHATAISAALSQIAAHLHDDETNCPLCRSNFDPGVLKALVDTAARSSDGRLAQADEALETLRAEAANLAPKIEMLRAQVAAPAEQERIAEEAARAVADARVAVARTLDIDPNEDIVTAVSERTQIAAAELAAAQSNLEPLVSRAAAAVEQRLSSSLEIEELIARESQVAARLLQSRGEEVACANRIAARNLSAASLEDIEAQITEKRRQLEAARVQLASLSAAASAATTALQSARSAHDAVQRELTAAEATRVAAEQSAQQMALRWKQAGFIDMPSQATYEQRLAAVDATLVGLRSLAERQNVLARENEDALLQGEINEVLASMKKASDEAGATDPAQHLGDLEAKLEVARTAVKMTVGTRTAVKRYSEDLQTLADDFSSRVLDPLNVVINDFNEAILSTPGESIQFKADTRVDATSFGMALRYREKVENSIEAKKDLPPQVVLSEGQLAANGFSILCAASIAYPWSRWRALLLDDPLQHNDIIHTAAFVDVMRNMVELNGYQLIMSSHDRGESDFIARKFDAAGLPCSTVLLTAPSDKGVSWDSPQHNQAATKLLRHGGATSANIA